MIIRWCNVQIDEYHLQAKTYPTICTHHKLYNNIEKIFPVFPKCWSVHSIATSSKTDGGALAMGGGFASSSVVAGTLISATSSVKEGKMSKHLNVAFFCWLFKKVVSNKYFKILCDDINNCRKLACQTTRHRNEKYNRNCLMAAEWSEVFMSIHTSAT